MIKEPKSHKMLKRDRLLLPFFSNFNDTTKHAPSNSSSTEKLLRVSSAVNWTVTKRNDRHLTSGADPKSSGGYWMRPIRPVTSSRAVLFWTGWSVMPRRTQRRPRPYTPSPRFVYYPITGHGSEDRRLGSEEGTKRLTVLPAWSTIVSSPVRRLSSSAPFGDRFATSQPSPLVLHRCVYQFIFWLPAESCELRFYAFSISFVTDKNFGIH